MTQVQKNVTRYALQVLFIILAIIIINNSSPSSKELPTPKYVDSSHIYTPIFPTVKISRYDGGLNYVAYTDSCTTISIPYRYRKFKIVEYVSLDNTHFFTTDSIYTRSDIYTKIK